MFKNLEKEIRDFNNSSVNSQRFLYLDVEEKEVFCMVEGGFNQTWHEFNHNKVALLFKAKNGEKMKLNRDSVIAKIKKYY